MLSRDAFLEKYVVKFRDSKFISTLLMMEICVFHVSVSILHRITLIRLLPANFFPKQVYLWGRVKSMDANVQIRSEMCV